MKIIMARMLCICWAILSLNAYASGLSFQEIQLPVNGRTPENISLYPAPDGNVKISYKLSDNETTGDIFSSVMLGSNWSQPLAENILNQSSFTLYGVVQLSNSASMMLVRGDDTDYAKLFGLTEAPATPANDTDPILPDISNEQLSALLDDNQRLFFCINSGNGWSTPQAIPGTNRASKAVIISGENDTALVVYAIDQDQDESTSTDVELYYAIYQNGAWTDSVRLTNNNLFDYEPKLQYLNGDYIITWLAYSDNGSTNAEFYYSKISNDGSVSVAPVSISNKNDSSASYVLGFDGNNIHLLWTEKAANDKYQIVDKQYVGNQWSAVVSSQIYADDFKNAKIVNYNDYAYLFYQNGYNINIAKFNNGDWSVLAVLDDLAVKKINYSEISFDVIANKLWVAYSGHDLVADEENNLDAGSGLYISSYPILPDLTVDSVRVKTGAVNINQNSDVLIEITNKGIVDSLSYQVRILKNNEVFSVLNGGSLAVGGKSTFYVPITPVSEITDLKIDIIYSSEEVNQENNSKSYLLKVYPDFYIKKVNRTSDTHFEVYAFERKGIAAPSVDLKAYLVINGVQTEIGVNTYNPAKLQPVTFDIPSLSTQTGDYNVLFKLNPDKKVVEDNYSNNQAVYSQKIDSRPEYVIQSLKQTDQSIQLDIINTGNLIADPVGLLITDEPDQAVSETELQNPWYYQDVTLDSQGNANILLNKTDLPQINGQYLYAIVNPYGVISEIDRNNNMSKILMVSHAEPVIGNISLSYQSQEYICRNLNFIIANTGTEVLKGVKMVLATDGNVAIASNQLPFLAVGGHESVSFHNIDQGNYQLHLMYFSNSGYVEYDSQPIALSSDDCSTQGALNDVSLNSIIDAGADGASPNYMIDVDIRANGYTTDYKKPLIRLPLILDIKQGTNLVSTFSKIVYTIPTSNENLTRIFIPNDILPVGNFEVVGRIGVRTDESITSNNVFSINVHRE